jgi:hypothetical protein
MYICTIERVIRFSAMFLMIQITVKIPVWKAGMRNTEQLLLLYHIELYLTEPVRHSYGQNYSHNFPFGLLSTSLLGFTLVECLSELPIAIGYDRFLTLPRL